MSLKKAITHAERARRLLLAKVTEEERQPEWTYFTGAYFLVAGALDDLQKAASCPKH